MVFRWVLHKKSGGVFGLLQTLVFMSTPFCTKMGRGSRVYHEFAMLTAGFVLKQKRILYGFQRDMAMPQQY